MSINEVDNTNNVINNENSCKYANNDVHEPENQKNM